MPCPAAVAAAMVTNPQAITKGAIMFLTNFVFISVISFHCFGLPWLPTVGGHFWPFTGVLSKIRREVTRKVGKPWIAHLLSYGVQAADGIDNE